MDLQSWDFWEPLLQLLGAIGAGALIGWERETRDRPAGMRTHMLVCLASCLLIVASRSAAFFGLDSIDNFQMVADPARMAAGVITGVGFLGAGTIFREQDFIKGLTTAASIWAVSAIGIAIGLGAYILAGIAAISIFTVLVSSRLRRHR